VIPKYVLNPGYVYSRHDGQRHYIGAQQLAFCYGVRMAECITRPVPQPGLPDRWEKLDGQIDLFPRFDGNYSLPNS